MSALAASLWGYVPQHLFDVVSAALVRGTSTDWAHSTLTHTRQGIAHTSGIQSQMPAERTWSANRQTGLREPPPPTPIAFAGLDVANWFAEERYLRREDRQGPSPGALNNGVSAGARLQRAETRPRLAVMAYNQELAERVRERVLRTAGLAELKMFGGWGVTIFGNMAVGVMDADLIVRVGPDAFADALARPGARPFDFTGTEDALAAAHSVAYHGATDRDRCAIDFECAVTTTKAEGADAPRSQLSAMPRCSHRSMKANGVMGETAPQGFVSDWGSAGPGVPIDE